jgi:hypothetical protein
MTLKENQTAPRATTTKPTKNQRSLICHALPHPALSQRRYPVACPDDTYRKPRPTLHIRSNLGAVHAVPLPRSRDDMPIRGQNLNLGRDPPSSEPRPPRNRGSPIGRDAVHGPPNNRRITTSPRQTSLVVHAADPTSATDPEIPPRSHRCEDRPDRSVDRHIPVVDRSRRVVQTSPDP